jgi:hypothetical protein
MKKEHWKEIGLIVMWALVAAGTFAQQNWFVYSWALIAIGLRAGKLTWGK